MVPAVLSCALLGLLCEEALAFSSSIGLMPELNRNSNLRDNAASAQSRSSVWWGDVPGPLRVREARSRADWDSAGGWWVASLADGLEGRAVSQTCRQLLLEFGDRGAALVGCALKNARPVQVCERCLSDFHSFWDAFANLSKNSGNDSCSTQLLTSDSLQIVLKIRNFLQLIWIKSQCDACLNENKTAPSMDTLNFKKLLNDSLNCFEQHSRHPVYKNYSDLCIKCKASYNNLTEHYSRMEKNENLCIDIIDAMNLTRQLWSKTYNCTVHCSDIIPVIALSTFFLFLPVIFYLSSFLHSEQKKLKLIEPKRLKHTTSTTSIR